MNLGDVPDRKTKTIFFAGTDTDVGKTYVASMAARLLYQNGVAVGVYKPVASGCQMQDGGLVAEDAVSLWHAAGKPRTIQDVCPQRFREPLAPPESAAMEGRQVDRDAMVCGLERWLSDDFDVCIVEGAGGLMSPIADGTLNLDFAHQIRPDRVIVVAANRLGTIHQTLATIAAAKLNGLTIDGIVLNQATPDGHRSQETNAEQIASFCDVPVLAELGYDDSDCPGAFAQWLAKNVANDR